MPELPEVETTRRGLAPRVAGRTIRDVVIRDRRLRWPVPRDLGVRLRGCRVEAIRRRGKYLLFDCGTGCLLVHLGMSGSLTLVRAGSTPRPHDHADIVLDTGEAVRFNDPRRFGALLWTNAPERHPLLASLGLEPFDPAFGGEALHRLARGRRVAVKQFLMDAKVVTGIGNIYANEALFAARIHPGRPAGRISLARYERLAQEIRATLERALAAGGSTLRDFVDSDGNPGHFQRQYAVYARDGAPCAACGAPIRTVRHSGRSTFFCARCQR